MQHGIRDQVIPSQPGWQVLAEGLYESARKGSAQSASDVVPNVELRFHSKSKPQRLVAWLYTDSRAVSCSASNEGVRNVFMWVKATESVWVKQVSTAS